MKKTLKYLLIALALLLALTLATVAYIAATFNPNEHKPQLIELVRQHTGRTLAIPGDIRLTFFPRIGADLGQISLSEPRSEQVFAAVQQVKVSVALLPLLRKEVQVDRVLLDGLSLQVKRDARGRFNFDDLTGPKTASPPPASQPESASAPAGLPLLDIGGITVSRSRLDYADAASGQHLQVTNLELHTGAIRHGERAQLTLEAMISATQPALNLRLALRADYTPRLAEQALRLDDVDFTTKGDAAGLRELQAHLAVASVEASATKVDAQGLTLEFTGPNPSGSPLSLKTKGTASADLARAQAQLALDGQLDTTTLALKTTLTDFARPAIQFELNLGDLDVDRYLPPPVAKSGATTAEPASQAVAESEIRLPALVGLDVRGTLRVNALKVMNVRSSNLRLTLRAQGERMELNPVTATLYGGGVNGRMSAVGGPGQRLAAKLDLRGIQIGPLMKDAVGQQPLEGRGNVALDLTTGGHTMGQFKRQLNGSAGVQLSEGAINGIDIAGALRNAKAKMGGGTPSGGSGGPQRTDFSEFSASFKITNGVAHNDDLSAKTPLLRLGGAGDVFIAEDRLDYTVKATIVPTLEGQGGPELEQLKGVTIPVRLSGPYSSIAWKVDLGSAAGGRARELVEQRKAQLEQEARKKLEEEQARARQRLQEQMQDRLKNLVPR